MEEILKICLEYVAIWAPALASILGVVAIVIAAVGRVKNAINEFKADETLKDVNKKLIDLTSENEELIRCNKLLLDNITKIKDYADNKKKEE